MGFWLSYLPEAKAEDDSSQESHDAGGKDEELVCLELGGLLELVYNPEAEAKARDEKDPEDEEDDGTEDVDNLVEGEVIHGWVDWS